ncbi:hypothetical protein CXP39_03130 [Mesoplasma syrphidae]|uniref:Uncharacterized protein n=1 Tax=Mesoplasma syrphidae TaxID=225999 RepID=A0A2K9BZI9_9MOLU|nr:hypothetical protein [Mesoplasma syrphidae]AUF83778.1 hypothetical protein CXP39_03130 [Mesoplasma syrphidae]
MPKTLLMFSSAIGLSISPLLYFNNSINNIERKNVTLKNAKDIDIIDFNRKLYLEQNGELSNTLKVEKLLKYLSENESTYKILSQYSSPRNDVEYYWWGYKIFFDWETLKLNGNPGLNPTKGVSVGTVVKLLKIFLPKVLKGGIILGGAILLEIATCLVAKKFWENSSGVVVRMLWIGIMTGCYDQ